MFPKTIEWIDGKVRFIDQLSLPRKLRFIETTSPERIIEAIKNMEIRGAPALGAAAALALALTAFHSKAKDLENIVRELKNIAEELRRSRPTARNLFWAIDRIMKKVEEFKGSVEELRQVVLDEAIKILREDIEVNRKIGEYGANLIEDGDTILTYCNAGSLATVHYGTALGVIRRAWEEGKKIRVIAPETRPKLQGARLTCFELVYEGIPVTLITDNSIGLLMTKGLIDKVIVGADRVLKDGTVYNKIGTYMIAVLAKRHKIPFYVAAPTSTFDLESSVNEVVIEQRDPREVIEICGCKLAPEEVEVMNFAFDITPPELITAIITEIGVIRPPYEENIRKALIKNPALRQDNSDVTK